MRINLHSTRVLLVASATSALLGTTLLPGGQSWSGAAGGVQPQQAASAPAVGAARTAGAAAAAEAAATRTTTTRTTATRTTATRTTAARATATRTSVLQAPVRITTYPYAVRDSRGQRWEPRSGFVGAKYAPFWPAPIAGTIEDHLYRPELWGMSGWSRPVANGTYEVTLKLRERTFNRVGRRVFTVTSEGAVVVRNLDVFAKAGKNRAYDVTFRTQVRDQRLDLGFRASADQPMVSALEVRHVAAAPTPPPPPPTPPTPPTPPVPPTPPTPPAQPSSYADRMVAGYKMVYSGTGGRLSSYPASANVVILAFAAQDEGPLKLVGYSAQGKASLASEIRARQQAGGKIAISVGGEGIRIDTSNPTTFVRDFVAIGTDLGFVPDGIDWDIEHSNNANQIVVISRALRAHYGPGFGITYSAGGSNNESDAENRAAAGRALHQAGLLDSYAWQFYMSDVTLDLAKWRLTWLIERGIPADKLAIGMMIGNDAISWTNAESVAYMTELKRTFGITKAALWANPWDDLDTRWANDMRAIFG